jgi:hypothetical protein
MTYKICQVIFSTNRIEYLTKTLMAQRNLDFTGCDVHRIFIDDFPKDRNNMMISALVQSFGYTELHLHPVNQGLSVTWTNFWNSIKDQNYDYIWHQEDDVEITEPIKIVELIDLLKADPGLSQIILKRQPWYFHETESQPLDTDTIHGNFRYERGGVLFSPIASLYPIDRARFNYNEWYTSKYPEEPTLHGAKLNEGYIGKALVEEQGLVNCLVKNSQGKNLIRHIGEWFVGQRVLPTDPGYEQFAKYHPETKYYSTTGDLYDK